MDTPLSGKAREILAKQFRGLWTVAGIYDGLEKACQSVVERGFWVEGWIAVRETMHFDSSGFTPEATSRLVALEGALRPRTLLEKVHAIVVPAGMLAVGVDSSVDSSIDSAADPLRSIQQVETMAQELGRAVARDHHDTLATLLPDLLTAESDQLWHFGCGLAESAEDANLVWNQLTRKLGLIPIEKQRVQVIRGFVGGLKNKDAQLVGVLLDDAVDNELAPWYPLLQTAGSIDVVAVERLIRSLDVGKAPIRSYRALVGGGVTHDLPGSSLNNLLRRLSTTSMGLDIAIEILMMRISFAKGKSSPAELIDIGCDLLCRLTFVEEKTDSIEHRLAVVAQNCLVGDKGYAAVGTICRNVKDAITNRDTYAFYHAGLLRSLCRVQPIAVLDALCGNDEAECHLGMSILHTIRPHTVLSTVSESELIAWCDQLPGERYPALAGAVICYGRSDTLGRLEWTPVARRLLERAPDRVAVLRRFIEGFSPRAWSGSRAGIVETCSQLLNDLDVYDDRHFQDFVANEKIRLARAVHTEKQSERLEKMMPENSFE